MSRWPPKQTMKFIKELIKHDCWYSSDSRDQTNRGAKAKALIKISEAMKLPHFGPRAVHSKIKNIRSTYSQELKKIRDNEAIGRTYTPNMAWFKLYQRALKGAKESKPDELSGDMDSSDVNRHVASQNPSLNQTDSEYYFVIDKTKGNPQENIKTEANDEFEAEVDETEEIYIAEHSDDSDEEMNASQADPIVKAKKVKITAARARTSILSSNEFDAFGKSIAAQLKNMPMRQALEAEKYIQNYLSNLRLELLPSRP